MLKYSLGLLFYLMLISRVRCWTDYEVVKYHKHNETTNYFVNNIDIKKIANNTYAFDGYMEFKEPLSDYFQVELNVYYKPVGAEDYNSSILITRMPRESVCHFMNNEYRLLSMQFVKDSTTFPYSTDPNVDLCAKIQPGKYYMHNHVIEKNRLPKDLIIGSYKLVLYGFYKNEVIQTIILEIRFY